MAAAAEARARQRRLPKGNERRAAGTVAKINITPLPSTLVTRAGARGLRASARVIRQKCKRIRCRVRAVVPGAKVSSVPPCVSDFPRARRQSVDDRDASARKLMKLKLHRLRLGRLFVVKLDGIISLEPVRSVLDRSRPRKTVTSLARGYVPFVWVQRKCQFRTAANYHPVPAGDLGDARKVGQPAR